MQQTNAQINTQPVQQTNVLSTGSTSVEMPWWYDTGHMYPFVDRVLNTNCNDSTKKQDVMPDEIGHKCISEYESLILQQSEKLYTAISEMEKLYDKYQKMIRVNFIKISMSEEYEQLLPVSVTEAINRLKNVIETKFADEKFQELRSQMERCEYEIRCCITGIFSHVYERDGLVYRLSDRNQTLDRMRKNIDFRLMGKRHIAELEKDLPYKTKIDSVTTMEESTLPSTAINQPISNTESTLPSTAINQPSSLVTASDEKTASRTLAPTSLPISAPTSLLTSAPTSTTTPINVQSNYYKELSGDEILANYYETAIYEEENEPLTIEELYDR